MPEVFNGPADKGGFSVGSAADFSEGLIHSAIEDPITGIAGLCHKQVHLTGDYNKDSLASQLNMPLSALVCRWGSSFRAR